MFFKLLRSSLILLVAVSLISCSNSVANPEARTSTNETTLQINALTFVTGSLFSQPVDLSGKLFLSAWLDPDGSDFDQKIWDDFTLQSNETITEINWVGGYDPLKNGMGGPVLDFTLAIYPSIAAGTEPAVAGPPLVKYQTGGSAGETSIGMVGGIPMYAYAFSLTTPFNASAGIKYWVHIVASQGGSSPDWGIAAGTGGNSSHYRWGAGAGGDSGFRSVPGDAAFTLLGPIPDIPTDIFLSNDTVDENQPVNTVVGALAAISPDPNATFTFSLTCAAAGVDDGFFNILGTNLQTSAIFDFETKSAYNICLRVTDQGGLTFDKDFVITVNNVNEAPTDISLSNTAVDENQPVNTVVGTLTATDPDAGATFTFSLGCTLAGADDASFNILGTNLQTSAIFDFETRSAYSICIRVTDQGGLTFDKDFVVTLKDLNEAPTDISLSHTAVDENQPANMVVGALTAIDPDAGATFTFNLACAGADNGAFNIQGTNLQTSATFDFETKSVYNLCLRVTDQGGLTFDKNFALTVNNLNEAPTGISLSNTTVDENQPINTVVGALTATDPDAGATFTFGLACAVAGADDASFNILGTDLRTSASFDFETKSTYNICIRVTDQGGLSFDKNFVVTVNDLYDPTSTPGKVTGGGNIGSEQGKDKITFGFNISYKEGDDEPEGNLTYQDHGTDLRLKATSFELLVIEGDHVWFTGVGVLNDGQLVTFRVEIDALSKLGQPDTFKIFIPALNGYAAGGALTGGNITIH